MLALREIHGAGFLAIRVQIAGHEPAICADQCQLGQDVWHQPGFIGQPREVGWLEAALGHSIAHAQRGLVDGSQNPQRLLLQHTGQVGALAFLGDQGILPFGVEGQAYQGARHDQCHGDEADDHGLQAFGA